MRRALTALALIVVIVVCAVAAALATLWQMFVSWMGSNRYGEGN